MEGLALWEHRDAVYFAMFYLTDAQLMDCERYHIWRNCYIIAMR